MFVKTLMKMAATASFAVVCMNAANASVVVSAQDAQYTPHRGGVVTHNIDVKPEWHTITGIKFELWGDLGSKREYVDMTSNIAGINGRWFNNKVSDNGGFDVIGTDGPDNGSDFDIDWSNHRPSAVYEIVSDGGSDAILDAMTANLTLSNTLSFSLNASKKVNDPWFFSTYLLIKDGWDVPFDFDLSFASRLTVTGLASVTAVPVPAALPLLVTALAGLGLLGWRRTI